LCFFDAQHI